MTSSYTQLRKDYLCEWQIWYRMHQRCDQSHQYYVEISVCDDWKGPAGFEQWLEDVGPKPHDDYVFSRINKLGDYELGNVEWTTKRKSQNTLSIHTEHQRAYHLKQACNNGIEKHTFYNRLYRGWSLEDASTLPASQIPYRNRIT